jgi:hypothetical protein
VSGGDDEHFYRACDPAVAKPRPGDLYCYHRHVEGTRNPYEQKGPSLFRSIFQDFADEAPRIIRTHCDIVVRNDPAARSVTVIGGNVHNAVTERVLNLTRQGVLSPRQGTKQCGSYNPDAVANVETNCNLNDQKWFVLLQAKRR